MKKLFLTLLISLFAASIASARDTGEVSLKLNQSVKLKRLTVKFISIEEDSRCPMNARCIWAGNAKVRVKLTVGRRTTTVDLNSGMNPTETEFAGYKVSFERLTEKPAGGGKIPYRPILRLRIGS